MIDKPSGEGRVCLVCSDMASLDAELCPRCSSLSKKSSETEPTIRSYVDNLASKMEFKKCPATSS